MPFRVDRSRAPRYAFVNESAETLRWVRVELDGPGLVASPLTPRLAPGACHAVDLRGVGFELDTRAIVRWRREDGEEFLWGVAL